MAAKSSCSGTAEASKPARDAMVYFLYEIDKNSMKWAKKDRGFLVLRKPQSTG
jgi:hypothetical protein